MIRKLLIALTLVSAAASHAAEDQDWILLSSLENGNKTYGRRSSFQKYEASGSMLIRMVSRDSTVSFYIVAIFDKECDAGFGQIAFFDTAWKLISKENYISRGGSGIAKIGDTLCYLINKTKGSAL